jgi:hypothetical protein
MAIAYNNLQEVIINECGKYEWVSGSVYTRLRLINERRKRVEGKGTDTGWFHRKRTPSEKLNYEIE